MRDKDLEETKPIKILSDLSDSRFDRYETRDKEETRSEKYEDVLIEDEKKEKAEMAEEALAEKNIAEAEALLAKDENKDVKEETKKDKKKKKVEEEDDEDDEITEDDGLLGKLIVKWKALPKKKRTLIGIGAILLLLILIFLVIFVILKLTSGPTKETKKPTVEEEKEVIPVIVDNFYYKKGSLYFLNENNEEIGSYECTTKDDKLCYVSYNNPNDTFDIARLENTDGKELKQRLPIYENNYVFIFDNSSEDGKEIVLYSINDGKEFARYTDVKAYADNYVIVKNEEDKYGLIQIQNGITEVIKPQYSYLGMIDGEANLVAKNKNGYVIINKKNKTQSSQFSGSLKVKTYNEKYLVTEASDEYSVYDYEGNAIISGVDFATVVDEYALYVTEKRLYVVDVLGNKYTENGIKLNTVDYVKTYVYDENDQLTETKKSFDVTYKDGILDVLVYTSGSAEGKSNQINTYEGKISQNYEYINYFDSKLYFYSDAEKKELIGSYTCTSENLVTNKDTEFATCFLAKDTISEDNDMVNSSLLNRKSYTPIINGRYVFIQDGSTKVVLYDLEAKESLSKKYYKVNTFTPNNDYKVVQTSGKVEAIVLNSSGLYGVVSIDGDTVTPIHTFKYNAIEKFGDYYLALDTSNYWRVLYGSSESAGFSGKIRGISPDKKHFKVMKDGKYYVYNSSVEKVMEDGYTYVELYNDYFATVNSSKEVNIYDYSGNKMNLVTVKVGDYKYYGVDSPAFKVKVSGEDYIVSVWNGTSYDETNVSVLEEPELGSDLGTGDVTE